MYLVNAILVGIKEIWAHKFRSLLTMLGIILGVASLVGMSALVKGMEKGMKEALVAMGGADKVLIEDEEVPPEQRHLADQATGRTMADVLALKNSAPLIKLVSPEMAVRNAPVTRGDKTADVEELVGCWPEILEMNLHTVAHGRMFNQIDDERAASVCVIGSGVRDALFGSPESAGRDIIPIGEIIQIGGQPFTIVGMFEHYESAQEKKERELARLKPKEAQQGPERQRGWGRRGGWAFYRKNMTVLMPLNTAWIKFRSASGANTLPDPRLSDIDIKVKDIAQLEPALQQARNILLLTHRGIEDFEFRTQENQVENINSQIRNARMSGGIIAAISLLVGGIGIMNIMLASINERVREIGICKAVGATGPAIFLQILVESVVIAIIGAFAGLAASYALVDLLASISPTGNTPEITPAAMALSVAFSAAVGIVAGFIPAVRAARMSPIQALRYE